MGIVLKPGTVGTRLIHGIWVDRWDEQNYPGEPAPNLEAMAEWIEALRSGHFKQTSRVLTAVDQNTAEKSHCCLGVLCEIAVQKKITNRWWPQEKVLNRWKPSTNTMAYGPALPEGGKHPDEEQYAVLPVDVMEWAGTRNSTMRLSRVAQVGELHDMTEVYATDLNDGAKMTFAQIADIAEYHFFGDAGVNGWADEQNKKEKA